MLLIASNVRRRKRMLVDDAGIGHDGIILRGSCFLILIVKERDIDRHVVRGGICQAPTVQMCRPRSRISPWSND